MADKVVYLPSSMPPVASGGGPPYDGGMDTRVAKLEDFVVDARDRLTKIETRLDQTATKTDMSEMGGKLQVEIHKGATDMIKWVVGTAIVLGAMAITIITFVLNNATPRVAATQPTPIIITVPQAATNPATAPIPPTQSTRP